MIDVDHHSVVPDVVQQQIVLIVDRNLNPEIVLLVHHVVLDLVLVSEDFVDHRTEQETGLGRENDLIDVATEEVDPVIDSGEDVLVAV